MLLLLLSILDLMNLEFIIVSFGILLGIGEKLIADSSIMFLVSLKGSFLMFVVGLITVSIVVELTGES